MTINKPRIEGLLRAVAGDDLRGVPVYLVGYSELEAYEPRLALKEALGWTSGWADLLLSDLMRSRGLWRGRGFGCAIDDNKITSFVDQAGIVLHEFTHYLDRPVSAPGQPVSKELLSLFEVQLLRKLPDTEKAFVTPIPDLQWEDHEAPFVRIACHVWYRANWVMECIRPRHLRFATQYYGPTFTDGHWIRSLRSELSSKRHLPITKILKTKPPESFEKLYHLATGITKME